MVDTKKDINQDNNQSVNSDGFNLNENSVLKKHAYLIMAHNEFSVLKKLVSLLDDPRNDIYLHVDKNSADFQEIDFSNIIKYSNLIFCNRLPISWGGYSQIKCEIELLKESIKQFHSYYHLISGVDLPIKRQDEIHAFFNENLGYEFISFDPRSFADYFSERIQYYYFFQEFLGHKKDNSKLFYLNKLLLKGQQLIGVNRIKNSNLVFKKGANWFSITHDLANYIVSMEKKINLGYKFTLAADEIFLNTIAWNSTFRERIIDSSLRFTDWKRGQPYIFRNEDFDTLIKSEALWARKFSALVDPVIIDRIIQHLTK